MRAAKFVFAFVLVVVVSCSQVALDKNSFFVSPEGNDSWSGRLAEPNPDGTNGPFLTPERAKQAVREFKNKNESIDSGVTVYLRGGTYTFSSSLVFKKEDSGAENAVICWKAYPGEKVIFSGGKKLADFHKLSDEKGLSLISDSVAHKIYEVDLKKAGVENIAPRIPRGSGYNSDKPLENELFFNGKAMTVARYPNSGWLKIANVPQWGAKLGYAGAHYQKRDGIRAGRHFGRFAISDSRVKKWPADENIWMHGYFTWDWSDMYEKVEKIDSQKLEIYPAQPYHRYGYTKGQRFYFYNILAELDAPGEYYIDEKSGKLFFYPPSDIEAGIAVISLLDEPIIVFNKADFIRMERIIFEYSRSEAIHAKNSNSVKIAGCVFRNVGSPAISMKGGKNDEILSCDLHDLAGAGIYLTSGDRLTLTPGNSRIVNNHIHNFGRVYRTYAPGIYMYGVGDYLAHNYVHDSPHMAVLFKGNDHILEYNEVHDIAKETGDVGAFYIGRNWTWRGNIIRYNYFHHLHGPGLYGVRAVYFDDFTSGNTIYGNIFYKAGKAAFIGGGRDNRVENNLFIECDPSVHVDARGTSWAFKYFKRDDPHFYPVLFDSMEAVHFDKPPYSEKYPELLNYYNDDPAVPKNNVIERNISYGGRFIDLWDGLDFDIVKVKNNFVADSVVVQMSESTDQTEDYVHYSIDDPMVREKMSSNTFFKGNPGIKGFKDEKFYLEKNSPAFEIGFEPIPVEKIGLYQDEFRSQIK